MYSVQDMFRRFNLIKLQNDPANINQDHLTICRTFTTVEQFETLADRLTTNIEKAIKWKHLMKLGIT